MGVKYENGDKPTSGDENTVGHSYSIMVGLLLADLHVSKGKAPVYLPNCFCEFCISGTNLFQSALCCRNGHRLV